MRRVVLALTLLLGVSLRAHAQDFTVSGHVIDAASGAPLGRTTVSLESTGQDGSAGDDPGGSRGRRGRATALADVTTGADGSFRFVGVPVGRYRLLASRRGYLASSLDQHGSFFAAVVVGAGKPVPPLRFPLLPLGHITGTVQDSSGDPVQRAQVRLFMQSLDGAGSIRSVRSSPVGRNQSRYSFDDLPPGTYYILVTGSPWFTQSQSSGDTGGPLDVAYAPTFFDGGTTSAEAQPISLAAGETAQANVTLHAVPAVHIEVSMEYGGALREQLAVPAFGSSVSLDSVAGTIRTGGAGAAQMNLAVAPGSYLVQQGSNRTPLSVTTDMQIPPTGDPLGVRVVGRLAMADGSALPEGASVLLASGAAPTGLADASPRLGVGFGRRQGGSGGEFLGGSFGERPLDVAMKPDGSFTADEVPPGSYRLALDTSGARSWQVTAAAATGATISDDLLLRVGNDPVMVAATLSPATASVTGVATDLRGAPESGAMILLVPVDGSAVLFRQAESDSDGTWTAQHVVPGKYHVIAISNGWDLKWKEPAVLARYLSGAVEANVGASGELKLEAPIPVRDR